VEEFEKKFEDYKDDVTSKFSNFVDSILEEEMIIPDKIIKYARLGELYEDLIDQFKVRLAIDEGLLDAEVKGMLGEAKTEITNLRDSVNELTGIKLTLEKDARDLATHIYLRKKCDGLTEGQKSSVMNILEGASRDDIDKKISVVLESIGTTSAEVITEESKLLGEMSDDEKKKYDDMDEDEKAEYMKNMKKKKDTTVQESTIEASVEVKETMNESVNPMMAQWKKMLRENKY
jgi:hypothetical protein